MMKLSQLAEKQDKRIARQKSAGAKKEYGF